MTTTNWTSADLLSRFNQRTQRLSSGDSISDTTKYQYLADAQAEILNRAASIAPKSLYGAPTAMVTADGGQTWTFGNDANGYPLFPYGKTKIYPDNGPSIPWGPLRPGIDYLDEGVTIRMTGGTSWSGTLYWYGMDPPSQMGSGVEPILQPPEARNIIPVLAAKHFAQDGREFDAAQMFDLEYEKLFGPLMTLLRTHFRGGGGMGFLLTPFGAPGSLYGPGWAGAWW